jgi:hypothetical protein
MDPILVLLADGPACALLSSDLLQQKVPWAVTANVAFKNTPVRFDPIFPRTGGGEDIDFAIKAAAGQLIAVPSASVTHPWWKGGARDYQRFWGWAFGDGALGDLYPQYSYRTWWSASELIIAFLVFGMITFAVGLVSLTLGYALQALAHPDTLAVVQQQQVVGYKMLDYLGVRWMRLRTSSAETLGCLPLPAAVGICVGLSRLGLQVWWQCFKAALVVKAIDVALDVARQCLLQVST